MTKTGRPKAELVLTEEERDALARLMSLPRLWPQMTHEERAAITQATLERVVVDVADASVVGFTPRPHLDVLFQTMALEHAPAKPGPLERCVWWTRGGSNP